MDELEQILNDMRTLTTTDCTKSDKEVCPKCNGTGLIIERRPEGDFGIECDCGLLKSQRSDNLLKFANIPEMFKYNRLSNFKIDCYSDKSKVKGRLKVIHYFVDEYEQMKTKGMGLYLFSSVKGSGKTRMITSVANELIDKGVQVKFATSVDIINAIKSTWEDKRSPETATTTESELLYALQTTEVLIIDDFGTEKVKDWQLEKWYSIINTRYVNKKVTLFTSNMSLDDLNYDNRITNRIKERTYQIHFAEESIRDLIKKQNNKDILKIIN